MADIFRDTPDLGAIRDAVAASPKVRDIGIVNMPGDDSDGTFTVDLASGAVIRVQMTVIAPRPFPED